MLNIIESRKHGHILAVENGYIHFDNTECQQNLLRSIINLNNGSQAYICGENGSGKTAFVVNTLKDETNSIIKIDGFSLMKNYRNPIEEIKLQFRNAIKVIFEENMRVVEGEVLNISEDKLTLKTVDMESIFEIGSQIKAELKRKRVIVGDIIKIYKDSGYVTKIGHSPSQRPELQSIYYNQTPLPEGECFKNENVLSKISIYELDLLNCHECDFNDIFSTSSKINPFISEEVDQKIVKMIKEGKAKIEKGIIVIENSQCLSRETFEFIYSLNNYEMSPTVIFLGIEKEHPLKNKIFNFRLNNINREVLSEILRKRANYIEICSIDDGSLSYLADISSKYSIKYAFNLLDIVASEHSNISLQELKSLEEIFKPFNQSEINS